MNNYKEVLKKCVSSLEYDDEMFLEKLDITKDIAKFPHRGIIEKKLVGWANECGLHTECCFDGGWSRWIAELEEELK